MSKKRLGVHKGRMTNSEKTRIWTICGQDTFQELQGHGELLADPSRVVAEFSSAYRWMTVQVNKRLGTSVKTPWWGWHSWGKRNGRPDLRCGNHMPRGTKSILLELMINSNEVVLSQFDMWNWALDGEFVPARQAEVWHYSVKERRRIYPQGHVPTAKERRLSWQRIFDLRSGSVHYWGRHSERWIQACFPVLRVSDVVSTKLFVAK